MSYPVLRFAHIALPDRTSSVGFAEKESPSRPLFECGKSVLAGCLLLSLVLHGLGAWVLDFRPVHELIMDRLVLLDIAAPQPVSVSPLQAPSEEAKPVDVAPARTPIPDTASVPSPEPPPVPQDKAEAQQEKPVAEARQKPAGREAAPRESVTAPLPEPGVSTPQVPVGRVARQSGVTVLANESGQDALKHGAEARFMHGVATEEFVEENYIGEYSLGKLGKVWIEDDREGSGHLILHVEGLGLTRPLYRFNRYIYIYGESPDSPEPILGSVTFFSDGYHIHQFLMQHNSTHAYYPRRN